MSQYPESKLSTRATFYPLQELNGMANSMALSRRALDRNFINVMVILGNAGQPPCDYAVRETIP
jgi:hypothetical protein